MIEKINMRKKYREILDRCGRCGHSIVIYKLLGRGERIAQEIIDIIISSRNSAVEYLHGKQAVVGSSPTVSSNEVLLRQHEAPCVRSIHDRESSCHGNRSRHQEVLVSPWKTSPLRYP